MALPRLRILRLASLNAAKLTVDVPFGLSFNLLAKSMLMNEFCDPSSKSMLVDIDWFPAHIDDTAVFSKTSVRC